MRGLFRGAEGMDYPGGSAPADTGGEYAGRAAQWACGRREPGWAREGVGLERDSWVRIKGQKAGIWARQARCPARQHFFDDALDMAAKKMINVSEMRCANVEIGG